MYNKAALESICSVTQMASSVNLSRARFHELIKKGFFPPPVYCICTKRPFYPLSLQQQCLDIRGNGIGFNGQPILFNTPRKAKRKVIKASPHRQVVHHEDLTAILRSIHIRATDTEITQAVMSLYPKGLPQGPLDNTVVRDVMTYLENACPKGV